MITPEGVVVGKLSDGAYFGEIAILTENRRTTSVRTVCHCHFYTLSKEDFNAVLEGFPELRERIVAKAMQRLQKTMRARSKMPGGERRRSTHAACGSRRRSEFLNDTAGCLARGSVTGIAPRRDSTCAVAEQERHDRHANKRSSLPRRGSTALTTNGGQDETPEQATVLRAHANGGTQSTQEEWARKISAVEEDEEGEGEEEDDDDDEDDSSGEYEEMCTHAAPDTPCF